MRLCRITYFMLNRVVKKVILLSCFLFNRVLVRWFPKSEYRIKDIILFRNVFIYFYTTGESKNNKNKNMAENKLTEMLNNPNYDGKHRKNFI